MPNYAPRVQVVQTAPAGPSMRSQSIDNRINIERMYASDVGSFRREAAQRRGGAYARNVRTS